MSKLCNYFKSIEADPKPLSIQVNLTNTCKSRCVMCRKYTWPKESIEKGDLLAFIHGLRRLGLETVVLSGGEPLMHKDFIGIVNGIIAEGLKYSVITTTLTDYPDNLEYMINTADRIHVSVDAAEKDLFRKIRNSDFDEVMSNLKKIRNGMIEARTQLRISSTISKLNYREIFDLYALASFIGADINYYLVHTWKDLKMNENQIDEVARQLKLVNAYEVSGRSKTNARDLLDSIYYPDNKKFSKCIAKDIHMIIDADGSIYPCCTLMNDNGDYDETGEFSYGNIYDNNLYEILKAQRKLEYPIEACGDCGRFCSLNKEYEKYLEEKPVIFL